MGTGVPPSSTERCVLGGKELGPQHDVVSLVLCTCTRSAEPVRRKDQRWSDPVSAFFWPGVRVAAIPSHAPPPLDHAPSTAKAFEGWEIGIPARCFFCCASVLLYSSYRLSSIEGCASGNHAYTGHYASKKVLDALGTTHTYTTRTHSHICPRGGGGSDESVMMAT